MTFGGKFLFLLFLGITTPLFAGSFLTDHAGRYETTSSTSNPTFKVLYPYQSVGLGKLYQWIGGTTTGFTGKIDVSEFGVEVLLTRIVQNQFLAKDVFKYQFKDGEVRAVYLVQGKEIVLRNNPQTLVGSVGDNDLSVTDLATFPRTYPFPSGGEKPYMKKIGYELRLSTDSKYLQISVSVPYGSTLLTGPEAEGVASFTAIKLP